MPYDDLLDGAFEAREAYLARLAEDMADEPFDLPDEDPWL